MGSRGSTPDRSQGLEAAKPGVSGYQGGAKPKRRRQDDPVGRIPMWKILQMN
jgi:hypothetical protein